MRCSSVLGGGGRRRLHDQLADLFLGPVVERAEGPVGGPVAGI
jgi:hypothetical protein